MSANFSFGDYSRKGRALTFCVDVVDRPSGSAGPTSGSVRLVPRARNGIPPATREDYGRVWGEGPPRSGAGGTGIPSGARWGTTLLADGGGPPGPVAAVVRRFYSSAGGSRRRYPEIEDYWNKRSFMEFRRQSRTGRGWTPLGAGPFESTTAWGSKGVIHPRSSNRRTETTTTDNIHGRC